LPASILEKIEDVVDHRQQRFARIFDARQILALLADSIVLSTSSVMPITAFSGVRISWLMLARNVLLARLAASAPSSLAAAAPRPRVLLGDVADRGLQQHAAFEFHPRQQDRRRKLGAVDPPVPPLEKVRSLLHRDVDHLARFDRDKAPSGWYSGERSTGVHDVNCCSSRQPNSWTEAGLPARKPRSGSSTMMASRDESYSVRYRISLARIASSACRCWVMSRETPNVPAIRPLGGVQRHFRRQGPRDATVGPRFLLLLVDHRLARAHDLLFVGQGLRRVFAAEKVGVRFAHGLGRIREPEQSRQGPVDADEATGFILEVNAVREIVHQGVQQSRSCCSSSLALASSAVRTRTRTSNSSRAARSSPALFAAADQLPHALSQQRQLTHVRIVVRRFLVAHADHRHNPLAVKDRHVHVPLDVDVACGITLLQRIGSRVIVGKHRLGAAARLRPTSRSSPRDNESACR
jgi:hypothetical protein